jgi:hypothetical protein
MLSDDRELKLIQNFSELTKNKEVLLLVGYGQYKPENEVNSHYGLRMHIELETCLCERIQCLALFNPPKRSISGSTSRFCVQVFKLYLVMQLSAGFNGRMEN